MKMCNFAICNRALPTSIKSIIQIGIMQYLLKLWVVIMSVNHRIFCQCLFLKRFSLKNTK